MCVTSARSAIQYSTLRKTEPMTEDPWTQINGHAELAATIVEGVLGPAQVEWIRTHHERPDGTGYPAACERIRFPTVLLAVADAWDLMTVNGQRAD